MATIQSIAEYHEQEAATHMRIAEHHAAMAKDLRAKAAAAAAAEAEAQFAAALAQALPAPPPAQELPVFCTADEVGLRTKQVKIEDFKDFVAFSYQLKADLSKPFTEMGMADFKKFICEHKRADTGEQFKIGAATQIYNSMKLLTSRKGDLIIMAVAGSQGGGLELRRISGDYRYTEGILTKDGRRNYMHQFPTETVRKLSPDESKLVALDRKNPYALVWKSQIVV